MAKSKVEGISPAELENELKRKNIAPVYLLYGEEDFLLKEAVQALVENVVEESARSFNCDIFYGGEVDIQKIIGAASSYPMMAERRLVIVKEFEKVGNKEYLIPYLENPLPTTSLAIITAKTDFRQKIYDVLKTRAVPVACNIYYDNEMLAWIQARVKKLGKSITMEACQLLQARTGNSLGVVQSEVEKLIIFVGKNKEIRLEDVEVVVGMSKQYNIFELQRAIGLLQLNRALEILGYMLESGESAIGIVVMLTKYFQKIQVCHESRARKLSESVIVSKLKISPNFLREYLQASSNYSPDEVNRSYRFLLQADEALKFSADEKLTMTVLLFSLMKKEHSVENR